MEETMKILIFVALLIAMAPLGAMDGTAYRRGLEQDPEGLTATLRRLTGRITNRETVWVVSRHLALFSGDFTGARGLLPEGGLEPHEEVLLGWLEEKAGHPGDALFHYDRAWARSGRRHDRAVLSAQMLLLSQGAVTEARKRGIEATPDIGLPADLALVRTVLHLVSGDPRGAETFLTRTALWDGGDVGRSRFFQFRGLLWESQGSNALALSCWKTARLLTPGDARCRQKVDLLTAKLFPRIHWLDDAARKPSASKPPVDSLGEDSAASGRMGGIPPRSRSLLSEGDMEEPADLISPKNETETLTEAQVRSQAEAILKLVQGPAVSPRGIDLHREAWNRIDALDAAEGSALVRRLLWASRAKIAQVAGRSGMAKTFLDRGQRFPSTPLLPPVFVARLGEEIQSSLQREKAELDARKQTGADLDPLLLSRRLLSELLPPTRVMPIPESVRSAFDLPEPVAETNLWTNASMPEPPPVVGGPGRRLHFLAGKPVGVDQVTWDPNGRMAEMKCVEITDGGKPGSVWQVRRFQYPETNGTNRIETVMDPSGTVLRETVVRQETAGEAERAIEEVTVEGALTQILTRESNRIRVELPGGRLLQTIDREEDEGTWTETCRLGEEILWKDTLFYPDPAARIGTEIRRERRDGRGNLLEIRTRQFRGDFLLREDRREPDGRILESWLWVW